MSQVENTRPRTGQVLRPAQFGRSGGPSSRSGGQPSGQPRDWDDQWPANPIYPGNPPPAWADMGGPDGGGCGRHECGCGSSYCGPGSGFCWYCMKDFLVKEMACLLQTDPTLQAILNGPRQGVTNGAWPLPGQIGETLVGSATVNVPALAQGVNWQSTLSPLVLSPGNWWINNYSYWGTLYEGVYSYLNPIPPGVSGDMAGGLFSPTGITDATVADGATAVASVTVPTLLAFTVSINGQTGGSPAGPFIMQVMALRTS